MEYGLLAALVATNALWLLYLKGRDERDEGERAMWARYAHDSNPTVLEREPAEPPRDDRDVEGMLERGEFVT